MALKILRQIAGFIQNGVWYSIMADEVTDSSNREQLIICLRWVDDHLAAHEEFIGLYSVDKIDAATLVHVIKDTLIRLNLKLADSRGQCYDGAANMCGIRSGVATQLSAIEPRALFTHCYGHSLDLGACDSIKNSKIVKNALDVTYKVCKLLKYSPRRDSLFDKIKKDVCPGTTGFRVLCPTRWTVRAASLSSVIENYAVFQELWLECLDYTKDTETKARILGVEAQMKTFNYLFGVLLGEVILRNTDNLSHTLQHQHLSAAEGQNVASLTVKTLEKIRTDEAFALFWKKAELVRSQHNVSEPEQPRRRKTPRRYEVGESAGDFHDTPESYYKQQYLEAMDLIINFVKERFSQPGYATYIKMQDLVVKAAKSEEYHNELFFATNIYGADLDKARLETQLSMVGPFCSELTNPSFKDVLEKFRCLSSAEQSHFSEVVNVL